MSGSTITTPSSARSRAARRRRRRHFAFDRAHGRTRVDQRLVPQVHLPGAYAPALSEVVPAIERAGLWITDIEILRLHYAETLRCWRVGSRTTALAVARLYDERFCRMWEFYLTGAELMFRRLGGMVFQIQMAKRWDGVPLTRDYITDWERAQTAQAVAAE